MSYSEHSMTTEQIKAVKQLLDDRVALVMKAAAETVREHRARLDTDHEARKPQVQINPVFEVKTELPQVNVSAFHTELVLKVLREVAEIAANSPVPVVQAPEHSIVVNPTPVTIDLWRLETAIGTLSGFVAQVVDEQQANRQLVTLLSRAMGVLAQALEGMDRTNRAILAKLSEKRTETITTTFDEQGNATTIKRSE